ncbi:Ysw1p [Saccharomyces eubayanus]|uniref:Ysw1p n=1 Tax=Saccharomyces eubayanus TaxID=1080349 RepID=UPI0006C38434|nr:YSW1-like protein [Saccharomyces eubayanus]KOH00465.1 YSW1-like protein [Saccharomyces eubayanus]
MSNLSDTADGNDTKRGRFSNFAFTSENSILQKNSTLRNWFLKPTTDNKEAYCGKGESTIKVAQPNDTNSQHSVEEKKIGRRVKSFFKQANSNRYGNMSEDEDDASFWKRTDSKGPKQENTFINGEKQKGSFKKKIRNSFFKGSIESNEKTYANEKKPSQIEFSSDDENESHFTDANSHVIQSKSPEKTSPGKQWPTKSTDYKDHNVGSGENSEEEDEDDDEDEFCPLTPPENVLEGPYKFVFQTPNTFTSQPHLSTEKEYHKGGKYTIEYLSKSLTTLDIDIDFGAKEEPDFYSEKEIQKKIESIIQNIAVEMSKSKIGNNNEQNELEKLKKENTKLLKFKYEHSIQKQELISLNTRLESLNKKNKDLIIEVKKLKNNSENEKMKESTFTDENENESFTKSKIGPGVLTLNVNETRKEPQQATTKPSKYLPREIRNNETKLKHLEKKIFGLEKTLEKKRKQMKTNEVRLDLNKYTIAQFLNLMKSLNAILQFYNVYGNDLKEYNDNIIRVEACCSALNTKHSFEESSLRLQEHSFMRQMSPLFTNINFSLIDQLTMNFRFYERSANFQKETISGLRMMLEEKDDYIKTLMQHLKKRQSTKLIEDAQKGVSAIQS